MTAKNPGSCVIYVMANNGVRAEVKIRVTRSKVPAAKTVYKGGIYRLNKAGTAAVFVGPEKKNAARLAVADTVTIDGKRCPVTEIADAAGHGMKQLKSLTIGKNVAIIGKRAFDHCPALKTIVLRTEKLKSAGSIGENAFANGAGAPKVKCPAKRLKKYSAWLRKKGLPKDAVFSAGK